MEEDYDLVVRIDSLPDSSTLVARRLGTQSIGDRDGMRQCAGGGYPSREVTVALFAEQDTGRNRCAGGRGTGKKRAIRSCIVRSGTLQGLDEVALAYNGDALFPVDRRAESLLTYGKERRRLGALALFRTVEQRDG